MPLPALLLWALLICACAGVLPPSEKRPGQVSFGVVGDLPYNDVEVRLFPQLIEEMSQRRELDFVIHVGDLKDGGSTPCSDEMYRQAKRWFDLSRHPLIYTPGDNEWTDCHRPGLGRYDPVERLVRLRQIFFQDERSLGQQPLPLIRQSRDPAHAEFRENARWVMEEIVFATLHVVGSNNNLGRTPEGDAEHYRRMSATLSWMREAFGIARAQEMRALVLILHANPEFEERSEGRSGFQGFLAELEREVSALKKPVLFIHGDTHTFRVDHPLRRKSDGQRVENLTRLETFGSPTMGWVKVTIDPGSPPRFRIEPARFWRKAGREGRDPS